MSLEEETTKTAIMVDDLSRNDNWFDANKIKDWILSEPDISDMDLRPYYYACKEKIDYFAGRGVLNDVSEVINIMFR